MGNARSRSGKPGKSPKETGLQGRGADPTGPLDKPPPPPPPHPPPSPPPAPPPVPPQPEKILLRALFDFEKTTCDDLSFKKGDILWVYKNWLEKNPNSDWWLATHEASSKTGYIPHNFVFKDLQEWWFDYKRPEAERRLKAARCKEGTFLVRPASDIRNKALSVRTHTASGERCVKHYQIRMMEDETRCYITDKRICASIFDLIRHYSEIQDGLCTRLTEPYRCTKTTYPDVVEIPRKDVTTTEKLGHGCFGEVYRGLLGLQTVAVKKLKTGAAMSPEAFLHEAQIMTALRHNHLVRLIGVCSKEEPLLIVTEFMVHGALLHYMKQDRGTNITLPVVIDMAAQIADGMHYLESQNFVHRDLRAANILVGEDNEVKVADFGLARPLGEDEDVYKAAENTKFPVKWTAPEAAMRREFSPKSDVWSFGVLLFELITLGAVPYCGMSGREVLQEIQRGYRMPRPLGTALPCSQPYYDVMVTCWKARPEERPTFEHLQDTFENWTVASSGQYS